MAQIELRISSKVQKDTQRSEVLLRFFGTKFDLYGKTEIYVSPNHFEYYVNRKLTKENGIKISEKVITTTKEEAFKKKYIIRQSGEVCVRNRIDNDDKKFHDLAKRRIEELKHFLVTNYEEADKTTINKEWLQQTIDKFNHPERKQINQNSGFFDLFNDYLEKSPKAIITEKGFKVLIRILMRYEMFVRLTDDKQFTLDIDTITTETLEDIESYIKNEHTLLDEYPNIYKTIPASTDAQRKSPKPQARGHNTMCAIFTRLRAFFNWCVERGITTNRPFDRYTGSLQEKYGTPYYLTIEERNKIADFDLSEHPNLSIQRDIFVFHCCVGCRVSDLMRLQSKDIIDGEVNYIPHKTKEETPIVVKVPLNDRASKLVEKYKGVDRKGRLFPFISSQNYNYAIKEIFALCGVTRLVTILNSTTGEEEKKPINEVASSHLARRCFVGNLYKQLKDPNIISPMSGHKPGSAAFARYREIDKEDRQNAVNLIN